MPYDVNRYNRLIASAAFDCSFYTGSIQDRSSPAQRAMSFVGSPSFAMVNGLPALKQNAANDGATSGAVASVVDTRVAFWCEVLLQLPSMLNIAYPIRQHDGGGNGFRVYWDTNQYLVLMTLTNAFGAARYGTTAVGTVPRGRLVHGIGRLDPVGLTSQWWLNGIPAVTTFINSGVPGLCGPAAIILGFGGPSLGSVVTRVWQGTPSNEDCVTLYQAAKTLVGGEV